jgi:hypothetical protein
MYPLSNPVRYDAEQRSALIDESSRLLGLRTGSEGGPACQPTGFRTTAILVPMELVRAHALP